VVRSVDTGGPTWYMLSSHTKRSVWSWLAILAVVIAAGPYPRRRWGSSDHTGLHRDSNASASLHIIPPRRCATKPDRQRSEVVNCPGWDASPVLISGIYRSLTAQGPRFRPGVQRVRDDYIKSVLLVVYHTAKTALGSEGGLIRPREGSEAPIPHRVYKFEGVPRVCVRVSFRTVNYLT
jgi:hypothetical protein